MSNVDLGSATGRLRLDARGVGVGVNQANSYFAQLEKTVATNWWGIRNLSMAFAALPVAITAGLAAAVKATTEWETAMAGVERTTFEIGLPEEENMANLRELEGQLLEMSKIKPIATVELAGIAEAAGALGVAREDIIQFTSATADLAATTDLTADAAATALARIGGLTGLTGAQYDNLASSILEVGRSTAATETEIVSTATRLAGVAQVVGLTADQIVGISGTLQSVGIKSQAGGTAIQRTFIDIMQAITANGDQLAIWAKLTGESTEAFKASFETDAAATLARVTQGLGALSVQGVDTTAVLSNLGITEARQIQALLALAAGQNTAATSGFNLTENLLRSQKAMDAGSAATDIAGRKYKTFASGIQILKNNLFALGVTIGKDVLPIIRPVLNVFVDLIRGINGLPGPIRGVIGIFLGITTVVLGFLAILGLVIPRIVIGAGAFRDLAGAAKGGIGALFGHSKALDADTAAATRNAKANTAAAAAQRQTPAGAPGGYVRGAPTSGGAGKTAIIPGAGARAGKGTASTATAAAKATQAQTKATADLANQASKTTSKLGKFAKGGGILTLVMTALTVGTAMYGNKLGDAANKQAKATAKSDDLVAALKDQAKHANGAADNWVKLQLAQRGATETARALGISEENLLSIVKGTASQAEVDAIGKAIKDNKARVAGTKELGTALGQLHAIYRNSAAESGVVVRANGRMTLSDEDLELQWQETSEAAKKKAEQIEEMAQGHVDYVASLLSVRDAEQGVEDALREYAEAQEAAADTTEEMVDLQDSLTDALHSLEDAQRDAAEAQVAVDRARQDGLDQLADAEDSLADANDRYQSSLDDIAEKEEEVAKLRAGPEAKALRDAIAKLRDANLDLVKATQKVEDAEWQLQYLREEGASQRDIQDAEQVVQESRNEVIDANNNLIDSEDDLRELRENHPQELREAERELAAARRDSAGTLRDIRQQEQEVADLRAKVAADTFYTDALREQRDANNQVRDAVKQVREAEQELAKFRQENKAQRDLADAELAVEDAIYAEAEAQKERRAAMAAMEGKPLTAAQEAHVLAEELQKLVGQAPTPAARRRLEQYIDILRKAPVTPPAPEPQPPKLPPVAAPPPPLKLPSVFEPPKKGIVDTITESMGGPVGMALTGAALGAMIGGPIGAAVGLAIGGGVGIAFSDIDWNKIQTDFKAGWDIIWNKDNWDSFSSIKRFKDDFVTGFKILFGIGSPSKVMEGLGLDVIWGFVLGVLGIPGEVIAVGVKIKNWVFEKFGDAWEWLKEKGRDIINGFLFGVEIMKEEVGRKVGEVKDRAVGIWDKAWEMLVEPGKDLIKGLYNGVKDAFDNWFKPNWNEMIDWIPGEFADRFKIGSPSRVFYDMGQYLIQGLANGIGKTSPVDRAMQDLQRAVDAIHVDQELEQMWEMRDAMWAIRDAAGSIDLRDLKQWYLEGRGAGWNLPGRDGEVGLNLPPQDGVHLAPITNNWTFDLDTHTDASAPELMNEFFWGARIRTRS